MDKLTQARVDGLQAKGKPYWVKDGTVPNLRVLVSKAGSVSYLLRKGGSTVTLGRRETMSLQEARRIALTGETPAEVRDASRTIGDWINGYEVDTSHLRCCRHRAQALRMVLGPLLQRELPALSRTWLISRCDALLAGGYKASTVKSYRTAVAMLLHWIGDKDAGYRTPLRRMPRLPVDRRIKFLDPGDIMRLEQWCERATDLKLACFTMLALHAGLRRTEALTLQRSELVLSGRHPHLTVLPGKSKSRRGRTIGLSATLKGFLAERLPRLPERDPFLFRGVDQRFARMVTEARLQTRITPHGLRHTFATQLISRGVAANVVRDALGHADLAMTSLYSHALATDVLEAPRVLDQPNFKARYSSR